MNNKYYSVLIGPGRKLTANLLVAKHESKSGIAIVEHILPPGTIAAPPHKHSKEDEISIILEGEITIWEEGKVSRFSAGEIAVKKRNILHTFWNEGATPLRFLEIITPGDFAEFFVAADKLLPADGSMNEQVQQKFDILNTEYGLEMSYKEIPSILEKHNLHL